MLPMRLGITEEQAKLFIEEYYEPDIAEAMVKAAIRNGMSAYGTIMVRLEGGKFNLFRTPGIMLPERRKKKMINCATIMGRLTADPTLKTTTTGKEVCRFTVAVDRAISKGEKKADFIPVTAWEGTAKFVCDHFGKGSMIAVQGVIQTGTYQDGKGNKRATFEVVAKEISFCGSKNEGGQPRNSTPEEKPDMTEGLNGYYSNATAADFEEIVCDDEYGEY